MKLISWNVNGLRACLNKGFLDFFNKSTADIFCIQETKMNQTQAEINIDGYFQYWNSAIKKGYSGTVIFTKTEPLSVCYDIGIEKHAGEGRVITLEYESFYLVNVYAPNSKSELSRLDYRMEWEDDFREYVISLDLNKPVIICGDLNVAHNEIDLKNPKSSMGSAGFTKEERGKLTKLLSSGFLDSFRYLYPDEKGAYSWWSYMFKAREKNVGWRIDYFLVSDKLKTNINDSIIHSNIMGSDHCPVELTIFK
ncbi:MAG: hypothetical protein K0S55_1311 [Clostridia bacterium]|nr:hypothetical protein [Clostridia bacterium]